MSRTPRSKTAPTTLTAKERKQTAVTLRKSGATFATIGAALGVSEQQAHRYVTAALRDLAEKTSETAQELRTLEAQRLDAMLAGLWGKATKGDPQSVTAALRIMERRAKLFGLDTQEAQEQGPIVVRFEDPELTLLEAGYYDAPAQPRQEVANAQHTEVVAGLEMVVDRPWK